MRKDQIRLSRKLLKSVVAFESHKSINGLTLHNNYIQKLRMVTRIFPKHGQDDCLNVIDIDSGSADRTIHYSDMDLNIVHFWVNLKISLLNKKKAIGVEFEKYLQLCQCITLDLFGKI